MAVRQQGVMIFGKKHDQLGGEIRINRADRGDVRVVFSVDDGKVYHPGIVGLSPKEARRFAQSVLTAADVIEGVER